MRGPVTVQLSPLPPYRKYDTKVSPNSSSVAISANRKIYSNILCQNLPATNLFPLPVLGLGLRASKKYTRFIKRCVLFIENNYTFERLRVCPCPSKSCKKWDLSFFFVVVAVTYCRFPAIVRVQERKNKKVKVREVKSALLAQTRRHTGRKRQRGRTPLGGAIENGQLPVGSYSDTVRVKGSAETRRQATTSQQRQTNPTWDFNVTIYNGRYIVKYVVFNNIQCLIEK